MNTELRSPGAAGRNLESPGQEHEVRFFIKNFDSEFPDRPPHELEAACQRAYDELGPSECRQKLEARARELLST